jgi:hypothetical protein
MERRAVGLAVAMLFVAIACTSAETPAVSRAPSETPSCAPTREARWAEDVAALVERIEAIHPDPHHGVSAAELRRAADALVAALPSLDDHEILVGIMRLVALVGSGGGDGHMGVWPPDNADAIHRFPIRVWEFPDGVFVTAARAPYGDLVGARIVSVGGRPIDEVLERLDPVVPHDNASNLRAARTVFLTSAEVLSGLGLLADATTMDLRVEVGGVLRRASIGAVEAETFADWVGGWELPLPERADLPFTQHLTDEFRLTYLASSRALLVEYHAIGEDSFELVGEIEAAMHDRRVDQVVLDLRNNGGGEAGGYRELLRLLEGPEFDRPQGLSVLIGRLTFSAAASLVVLLDRRADHVRFVGEDTGGAPNFWADPTTVTLPTSGLRVLIPEGYFGIGGPDDRRFTVEPDVPVPFASTDYFRGRDPVLDRALRARD